MERKNKGIKIELKFTIPDESPQKEIIAKKFKELMDVLSEKEEVKNG